MYVYRGVHAKHKMLAAARNGIVVPGDVNGDFTADEHNLLDRSADSPFTSWTYSLSVARRFAASRGIGGVVLRLPKDEPTDSDDWSWHDSPDFHREQEVLLRGVRIGVEVLP
jgi:hypothetical protein